MKKIRHILFTLRHLKIWWKVSKLEWEIFCLPVLFPHVMAFIKAKSNMSKFVIYVTKDTNPFLDEFDKHFVDHNTIEGFLIIDSMQMAKAGNPKVVKYEYYPTLDKLIK